MQQELLVQESWIVSSLLTSCSRPLDLQNSGVAFALVSVVVDLSHSFQCGLKSPTIRACCSSSSLILMWYWRQKVEYTHRPELLDKQSHCQGCLLCTSQLFQGYCISLWGIYQYILPTHNYDSATVLGSVSSCLDYISSRGDTIVRVCFKVCLSETLEVRLPVLGRYYSELTTSLSKTSDV